MNKKAIAILGAIFILIVGTLGFLVYSKYSNKNPGPVSQNTTNPTPTPTTQNPSTTPTPAASATPSATPTLSAASNIVKLTDDQVVSPTISFDGQSVAYYDNQGQLLTASLTTDGTGKLAFSNKKNWNITPKPNVIKVLWPPHSNRYDELVETINSSGQVRWSYFNGQVGSYVDLPPQIQSVDWMPNGSQIAYVWLQDGKASLSIAKPDASNYKKLNDFWEPDDTIAVAPDGSQILYYETSSASAANPINSVSIDGKVFKGLVKNGLNMGVIWSPDSQKFLFAKKDVVSQSFQLWVYNLTSGEVKNLGLFSTTDKAVWGPDSNTVYAAVPVSGIAGGNSLTNDTFYKMNSNTLDKQQFSNNSGNAVDARDLFLDSTGTKLFFKNAQDGGLYYLDMSK